MLQPTLTQELEDVVGQAHITAALAGVCLDDTDVDVDVDVDAVVERKPHFLDYDAAVPPEYDDNYGYAAGEQLKMDKKFERDGEISDYELAASGYTKKEFTQDDNTLHFTQSTSGSGAKKPVKHFLDENPIPPDYMLAQELREHRSLDRNFERQSAQQQQQKELLLPTQRLGSPASSANVGSRISRSKEPSYTLSRFLDSDPGPPLPRLPKGAAWTSSTEVDATLGAKVECVYSLLSMLGSNDPLEMAKKFLELSGNSQSCATLRRSGCMPLLVQMMHAPDNDQEVRKCASLALHNVVHSHPDEKAGRREAKVLRLLDQIIDYCSFLKTLLQSGGEAIADDSDRHPLAAISSLMKVSFDEEHRHAMCELGALQVIPNLVHLDHAVHGPKPEDQCCNSLRRYALMALTNLTFGDENNKALLCGQKQFMEALVAQLDTSGPDDLLQVTASVLRNLSWRADSNMKAVLNEIGTVTALAKAAMRNKSENTLKAILSALWNLSAHCSTNKAEFCAVDGALAFLVGMLSYEGPSKTLKIIENAGGILRNVSSHIAVCEPYRQILRQHNCLAILLQQLKSESLTVVSNSCGTLWNLSARCPEDQKFLWDNGAVPMLRSLIHSKHAMISEGSSSALKNLLNFRPVVQNPDQLDPIARSMGLKQLPTLKARKQKALQQELGERHAETCDNLDGQQLKSSASKTRRQPAQRLTRSTMLTKSESRDSVYSAKSDTAYEHLMRTDAAQLQGQSQSSFEMQLEHDAEATEEQPIDYSAKYSEGATNGNNKATTTYQETDLDQPTDFSLRYAENQLESDLKPAVVDATPAKAAAGQQSVVAGQEILLILDDSVKCYQTEDTPYVISNAASVTDLRQTAKADAEVSPPAEVENVETELKSGQVTAATEAQPTTKKPCPKLTQCASGSYTPEKPINYCEEGTPGCFSRYDSLSSLDEPGKSATKSAKPVKEQAQPLREEESLAQAKPIVATNSALETPLMFSRRSSMDSLDVDVANCDDKSSVVSDFSRLASGVISPSELPDSPTQSMPQSPRRISVASANAVALPAANTQRPLRSVFEDDLSSFNVEHTPAQFSSATSLSNLSIVDDGKTVAVADAEDNDNDNEDDLLLASCINIGMQRSGATGAAATTATAAATALPEETTRRYCTEDTPAQLSKVGSNTNLSAISINSTAEIQPQRYSLNLSDDVSSNASDCGGRDATSAAQSANLLQQCIRDGMQKPALVSGSVTAAPLKPDPIAMLRRGGNVLPAYLPVSDEMSKYLVEDSPCNFSVVSGLSNLTVGSSLVGPAVQLKEQIGAAEVNPMKTASLLATAQVTPQEHAKQPPHWQDDSLSSLSIDSEDDTNLLSQAIAAGCNRPKSNLGFSSSATSSKRSSSLCSSSQPITINAATSACSLNSAMSARKTVQQESYSSVDSSDSNDNQSKSLFELCILNGMYKSKEPGRSQQLSVIGSSSNTQSNPNLKQFDSLPVQLPAQSKRQRHHHHHHHHHALRERERERKDEKLLLECINTGISKKINAVPKNSQATSAAALEPCHPMAATTSASANSTAAPDVEQKAHVIRHSTNNNSSCCKQTSRISSGNVTDIDTDEAKNLVLSPGIVNLIAPVTAIGSKQSQADNDADRSSDESNQSFILDTAIRLDALSDIVGLPQSRCSSDKHKDPDLMLKSVERLTLEFVTSAEQLRTGSHSHSQSQSHSHSRSNNTWNEHTCPNDVSFPSISQSAPVLASLSFDDDGDDPDATQAADLHDFAEITPTNELHLLTSLGVINGNPVEDAAAQLNSLDTHTLTETLSGDNNSNSSSTGLNFKLGGEVQSAAVRSSEQKQRQLLFNGTSGSMMSNSTMIAIEARALAENLQQLQAGNDDEDSAQLAFSINGSLDLDNVCPPSGMESLNSAYNTQPSSLRQLLPSKSPRFARKAFPANLVARRALGQLAGSAESVNSSCNLLDNIKPPSLMDELLDSMISVDSIRSEVADAEHDCSMATTISVSNYETAACDDQTLTLTVLQSCCDYDDEEDATMNEDFSSAESTPKQGSTPSPNRRTLTPKQKRRLAKDRYKTYTISSNAMDATEPNETLQIEIVDTMQATGPSPRTNGWRRGSADRYKTQLIECPLQLLRHDNDNFDEDDDSSEQLSSMRAMMQKFTYITDINIGQPKQEQEIPAQADDPPSCECDQNSETESCNEHTQSPLPTKILLQKQTSIKKATSPPILEPAAAVKVLRGRKKSAYISPYSMQSQRNSSSAAAATAAAAKNKTLSPTIAKRNAFPGTRLPAKKKATPPAQVQPASGSTTTRLERQGTFVKDEPTNVNTQVPIVEALSPTQRASKLPTKRTTTLITATTKTASPKRVIAKPVSATRGVVPGLPAQQKQQRANTNIRLASTKAAAATRVAAQAARISSTTPPSRSNSNLNGGSASAVAAAAAVKINQAQSRIANIWKRVDDAKNKAKNQPKSKQTSNLRTQQTKSSNTLNGGGGGGVGGAATRPMLLRSSTFDNTPPETVLGSTAAKSSSRLPVVGARK